jgi:hypothetical protein
LFAHGVALLKSENDAEVSAAGRGPTFVEQSEISDAEAIQYTPVVGSVAQMIIVASADISQSATVGISMRRARRATMRRSAGHPHRNTGECGSSRKSGSGFAIDPFGKSLFLAQVCFDLLGIGVIVG